jgi:hypothetical protein
MLGAGGGFPMTQMTQQSGATRLSARKAGMIGRVALLVVLGALLAGCDKCGDFWPRSELQSCRDEAPKPPQRW